MPDLAQQQRFDPWDPVNQRLLQIAQGDRREALLLRKAIDRGKRDGAARGLDNPAIANFRRSIFGDTAQSRGSSYRDYHRMNTDEVRLNFRRLAFAGPPDSVREEHSAFCVMMYLGYQSRFLDRHPGETPEEFLDRPRKTTLNITRVAIDILSQLYSNRPSRDFSESTPDHVREALSDIWSDAYDLELLEVDRYTRLEGTVAVRPIYDPEAPGKVRLMLFHSYQLRVIPDPLKPWQPLAVIERHEPFMANTRINIWTARTFATLDEEGTLRGEPHSMGRIPITFFKNRKSSAGSFFVEGAGRGLCDKNCIVNGKLTDLNEVFSYQGFSVPVVTNYDEDDLVIGPRRPLRFDGVDASTPHGLTWARPDAPLTELRQEVEADLVNAFTEQRIPLAALGARLDQRAVSGQSIKEAMKPLRDDFHERERLFSPADQDLADCCLRVRAEHDLEFNYNPETDKPKYAIDYIEPVLPMGTADQISKDGFDIAQGIITPVDVMMREGPGRHADREGYIEEWKSNIEETNSAARPGDLASTVAPPSDMLAEVAEPAFTEAAKEQELHRLRECFPAEWDAPKKNGNGKSSTPVLDSLMRHGLAGV